MKKIRERSFVVKTLCVFCFFAAFFCYSKETNAVQNSKKRSIKEIVENADFEEEPSIWESPAVETDNANIQILDKISGKVYRENVKLNSTKVFGSIELKLNRCFKNSPEDEKEVSAFIEITENGKVIFANWLFASSPSINLFSHPTYDVRVEF